MHKIILLWKQLHSQWIQPFQEKVNQWVGWMWMKASRGYRKHLAKICDPYILPLVKKAQPLVQWYRSQSSIVQKILGRYLFGALVMGLLTWMFMSEPPHKRNAPSVEIGSVRTASLREKATVIGSLVANQAVVLHAQVQGQITAIHFKGGQVVQKDQALIQLDDRTYLANLKEAESQLKTAQAEFERISKLANNNAFAPIKAKEQAEAKLKQAEANYEMRKFQMESTVIRAPFEGVVGLKDENLSIGTLVDQRQDLVTVVDVDPIRVKFSVPSNIALKIQSGQKVKIQVDSLGSRTFAAEIDAIDARVNSGTNTLMMQAVADNPHGLLKPGLFGRVFIEAGTKDGALVVPEVAVDMAGEESFVYRVLALKTKTGDTLVLAVKTQVTTGLRENETIEIVNGLKEGDLIITTGHMKLGAIDRAVVRAVNADEYPDLMKNVVDVSQPKNPEVQPSIGSAQTKSASDGGKRKKKKQEADDEDFDDADDETIDDDVPLVSAPKKGALMVPAKPSALDEIMEKPPTKKQSSDAIKKEEVSESDISQKRAPATKEDSTADSSAQDQKSTPDQEIA